METDESTNLLSSLLAAAEDELDENDKNIPRKLTETNIFENETDNITATNTETLKSSLVHSGDTDSSDDEGNRNYENKKYNEYGRDIKYLLDASQTQNRSYDGLKTSTNNDNVSRKVSLPQKTTPLPKSDVYMDPFFFIRIVNPLISSSTLRDRMAGREAVHMSKLKYFLSQKPEGKDWVVAGVVVNKFSKTSQKGNAFCVWTISDLHGDLKTVGVFLFGSAYKQFWKTTVGTVVGILNPSVLENRAGSTNEASLSVDNAQKIMIFGQSKDFGTCRSTKKNGEKCTAFVNVGRSEFCLYHIKQEYQKCSKRSELQANFAGRGLTALQNKLLGKKELAWGGKVYTAIHAKKNSKLKAKDDERMKLLSGGSVSRAPKVAKQKKLAAQLEMSINQKRKDLEMLRRLGGSKEEAKDAVKTKFVAESVSSIVTLEESKKTALDVISKLKAKNSKEKLLYDDGFCNNKSGKGNLLEENEEKSLDFTANEQEKIEDESLDNSYTGVSTEVDKTFTTSFHKKLKDDATIALEKNVESAKSSLVNNTEQKNAVISNDIEPRKLKNLEEIDLNVDYVKADKGLSSDLKRKTEEAKQVNEQVKNNEQNKLLEKSKGQSSSKENIEQLQEIDLNVDYRKIKKLSNNLNAAVKSPGTSEENKSMKHIDVLKKNKDNANANNDSDLKRKSEQVNKHESDKEESSACGSIAKNKSLEKSKSQSRTKSNLKEMHLNGDYTDRMKLSNNLSTLEKNEYMKPPKQSTSCFEVGAFEKIKKNIDNAKTATSKKDGVLNSSANSSGKTQEYLKQSPQNLINNEEKSDASMDVPILLDLKSKQIDLNAPISKIHKHRARINAAKYIQRNGPIKKSDPNSVRSTSKKRTLEIIENDPKKRKIQENKFYSERFKKMMAMTSAHTDLLQQHDDEEQEKYFQKLEMKERLEEKMASVYKVPCKAVRCLKCKYTNFSASDLCKTERHPLRVYDAVKRFFKCGNCGNRTVCLEVVPTVSCKNCGEGRWERTTMMKEKIVGKTHNLSIRGGEQKFVNSVVTDGNIDLMVAGD